jgi:hypothetical protein
MMVTPRNFWEALFTDPAGPKPGLHVQMRLLRKDGRPFLLFPRPALAAAATMDLYPAQTGRARAARMILRRLLRASLPFGTEKVSFQVSTEDLFARFLSSLAGRPEPGPPTLGILAGNPGSAGQRFLLLVFDGSQRPVAVVKAGLSQEARALIEKEESFLAAAPANTIGVPRLRATFQSPRLRALALDFFAGDSPRPEQEGALLPLLESWINPNRRIALSDTPEWARLEKAAAGNVLFPAIAARLQGRIIQTAIHHGDLAPWNIKVSPAGAWTVLDWERGELTGLPGWDWFHYVLQSAILVAHLPTPALVQRVGSLLKSAAFRQYAARAGIAGCERGLLLAYLLHAVEVLRPSEGLAPTRALLGALSASWPG